MGAHRIRGSALTLAVLATAFGCQPQNKGPTTREGSIAAQPAPPTTAPSTDPNEGSAEALARKAEEWAKLMESIRARQSAPATAPSTTQPAVVVATTQPAEATKAAAPAATSQPAAAAAPAEPPAGTTPALVFTPPATTAPVIEVRPPVASTQPVAATRPAPPRVVVKDVLVEQVRDALKAAPRDAAANLDYQLVRFLKEEQTPDLASLSNLSADDREVVSAVMDGLTNFRAALRADPNAMASRKVRPLLEMGDRLRAQADLQIPAVALCSAIKGYGLYDPLPSAFVEGRENRALLYCEISGFASRLGQGNQWETTLTEEVVLYRGDREVWRKGKPDPVTDHCRNKRHDFYLMNLLQFPASLPAGAYTLKVTVVDQIASRVAETTLPVTINTAAGATTTTADVAGAK
jgi:hypothetical protein